MHLRCSSVSSRAVITRSFSRRRSCSISANANSRRRPNGAERGSRPRIARRARGRDRNRRLCKAGADRHAKISSPRVASGARRRKSARTIVPATPARYRKRREAEAGAVAVEELAPGEPESIDPLDAQNAGLHDEAIQQGHEEINLNLDEFEAPPAERAGGEEEAKPNALPPPTPSEAAFEAAFAAFTGSAPPAAVSSPPSGERDAFVEAAFAKSSTVPARSVRAHCRGAGVSHQDQGRDLRRTPRHHRGIRGAGATWSSSASRRIHTISNAIAVRYGALMLGYIGAGMAAHLAPAMDGGVVYRARVASLTGGGEKHRGVNIFVERDAAANLAERDRGRAPLRESWDGDTERVVRALLGSAQPHAAQRDVLERVDAGRNTLAVFGTGRGKSFCFQLPGGAPSVRRGRQNARRLSVASPGERSVRRRSRARSIRSACVSTVPTGRSTTPSAAICSKRCARGRGTSSATPEFLEFHRDAFAGNSRPSFLVVDEAHHVHESRHRPAYARLGAAIAALGHPQVLALTATAGDEAFRKIVEALGITAWVIDPNHSRESARRRRPQPARQGRLPARSVRCR